MIQKTYNHNSIPNGSMVKLKEMGNVSEIMFQDNVNHKILIQKLNENEYIYLPTGEVLPCNHIKNRSESLFQVGQSLKRLRDIINTNVTDAKKCRWITLTYAENMTDTKKLKIDFEIFIKKLNRAMKSFKFEYIVAMEPQARGAWHAHLILIFYENAPYIPNNAIFALWQHGFTKTRKLNDIDNVGAYLTAYLGDIEYSPETVNRLGLRDTNICIKEVDNIEGKKLKTKKKFIKGGRLYMYPPKFNIYRFSRGIKKPIETNMSYEMARKKIGSIEPIYKTSFELVDCERLSGDSIFRKNIIYEFYNSKRYIPQN